MAVQLCETRPKWCTPISDFVCPAFSLLFSMPSGLSSGERSATLTCLGCVEKGRTTTPEAVRELSNICLCTEFSSHSGDNKPPPQCQRGGDIQVHTAYVHTHTHRHKRAPALVFHTKGHHTTRSSSIHEALWVRCPVHKLVQQDCTVLVLLEGNFSSA